MIANNNRYNLPACLSGDGSVILCRWTVFVHTDVASEATVLTLRSKVIVIAVMRCVTATHKGFFDVFFRHSTRSTPWAFTRFVHQSGFCLFFAARRRSCL